MKIVRLQSNNILRLTAVDISPDGNLITIGGKNGAGKSSVLNSIAMVLGGASMVPAEPIRIGETEAKIVADLGDWIVTRRFSRDRLHADGCLGLAGGDCTCNPVYSDTRSTLTVSSKDGAKYASPQAMLDKILGRLTFDPLAFAQDDPKRQLETLRSLAGIDTRGIEDMRKQASDLRLVTKKVYEGRYHIVAKMPFYENAPEKEIPLEEIERQIKETMAVAEEAARIRDEKTQLEFLIRSADIKRGDHRAEMALIVQQITVLQNKYNALDKNVSDLTDGIIDLRSKLADVTKKEEAAVEASTSFETLRAEWRRISDLNANVRANLEKEKAVQDLRNLENVIAGYDGDIAAADEAKRVMIESAQFPVPGLSLGDDGVMLNGIPFKQASSSDQLKVSVAIGLALNPTLKVLLIRNGNLLDEDSIKTVAEQAEAADAQIWMEYVTKDAGAVNVMIEDGSVAGS